MRIQFKPVYEVNEIIHVASGMTWKLGEVKDIPENAQATLIRNGDAYVCPLIKDLLSHPDFVVAETKTNPEYLCSKCGRVTHDEFVFDPIAEKARFLEIDGRRVCADCFAVPQVDDSNFKE